MTATPTPGPQPPATLPDATLPRVVLGDEEQLVLHRRTLKPHHLEPALEYWRAVEALYAMHGITTQRAVVETDAEPKLSWLYSMPRAGWRERIQTVTASPEHVALAAAAAPHVFRNLSVRPVRPEVLTHASAATVAGTAVPQRLAIVRRYDIVGGWEPFLAVWRRIVPVREKYGFRCLFAVVDEPKDLFTWAFDFDGEWSDFPSAQRGYYHDPERVELRKVFDFMADYSIHPASQLLT